MAERQSDQRLAQELNPETETGLLGPAFISASELAYRQKIREEAQAQPNNNPPIVQQLAQAAMSPQVSMQNEMPVPAAPMPQQQMPQQQMSPQGYAMGGLIRMANGGMPPPYDYDEKEIEDRMKGKARTWGGNLLSNIAWGAGDADALKSFAETGETSDRLTSALQRANLPSDATQDMVSAYRSGTPSAAFQSATADVSTAYSPSAIQNQLDQGNPVFVGGIDYGGNQFDDSLVTPVTTNQIANINNKSDDSDGVLTSTQDRLKQSINKGLNNKPTGIHADIARQSIDTGYMNIMTPDDRPPPITKKPTTGIGDAGKKDASIAALSDYEKLIQDRIAKMTDEKGRMQNKWLRIAAGAFNAAQKGSPTFLGGLADLGAGVTEELLALNQEEQKQAQELFALYTAREKLRRESLVSQRDLDKDQKTRYADAVKNYNSDLARYLNTDITKDMTKEEAEGITSVQYADMGVKPAQNIYARGIKKIQGKIDEIASDNPDYTTDERVAELDEWLKTNPGLAMIYDNYKDRGTEVEDWLLPALSRI
jgi:hypothetical protein